MCPGAVIDSRHVPSGTTVSVDHWTTKHDSRYWDEPMVFKPERWLDKSSQDVREASQSCSMGPQSCLDVNLAYLEMRIILAKMVFDFDWVLVNKDLDFLKETRLHLL
jgi:cytochrome P450